MPATVYLNTKISASSSQELSAEEKHPLQVCAEDRVLINQQFIRQISHSCLSSRAYRVVLAIFSQTLDFNKLEDDMNGTRLQQLTGIFPQHANAAVRDLEAMNAVITRKGRYGKYMSINFDFTQWGKGDCDKYPNNDPYFLLPDQEQYMDQPSALIPEDMETNTEAPPINETADDKPPVQQPLEEEVESQQVLDNAHIHQLLEQILQAIALLTTRVDRLEAHENSAVDDELAAPEESEPVIETEPETNEIEQPEPEPVTKPETLSATNLTEKQQPITHDTHDAIESTETRSLRFPLQLSQEQCHEAENLLKKVDEEKAQVLLDMLAKRLLNTSDPVKKPIAYLSNLLTRLQNNRLDMPCATTNSLASTEPRPLRESERRHAEYQEALADCMQTERNIKLMAEQDNVSFDECLDRLNMNEFWQSLKDHFKATKEALAAIQPMDSVAV